MSKIKVVEEYILIARRVPPGDKWRLVANEPDGPIPVSYTHLTLPTNREV